MEIGRWFKFCFAFSAMSLLAAHGVHECDHGLATNRAWVGPCLLGAAVVIYSLFQLMFSFAVSSGRINALLTLAVGLAPMLAVFIMNLPRFLYLAMHH